MAMGREPFTGFIRPSNESSPKTRYLEAISMGIMPDAANIPNAIGKSKPVPSFLMSAGAKFTVILSAGKL
jgi:hypothetical protein